MIFFMFVLIDIYLDLPDNHPLIETLREYDEKERSSKLRKSYQIEEEEEEEEGDENEDEEDDVIELRGEEMKQLNKTSFFNSFFTPSLSRKLLPNRKPNVKEKHKFILIIKFGR